MAESENRGVAERVAVLEARVERLERRVAVLEKTKRAAAPAPAARTYRDSFDALDYPDR